MHSAGCVPFLALQFTEEAVTLPHDQPHPDHRSQNGGGAPRQEGAQEPVIPDGPPVAAGVGGMTALGPE